MPVHKKGNKWAIGSGKAIYDSKEKAERAYRGYLGAKYGKMLKGGCMERNLNFFVPIEKFDEEQRMVYGVATCETLDKQNEIVDYAATKEALDDYSQWRNIREMHKPSAVGVAPVLELRDNKKELFIGAKIVDDQAWLKCKEGVYKGFSIGGEVLDRRIEVNKSGGKPINRVTKYVLNEISIVDRPANPACSFQTVKRDTSIETVTISEDPLKAESARVMEKALVFAKKCLTKEGLENLPDSAFGLIKVISDGDKLVKHRQYPMPDKVHAVNMIKKMVGCDELSSNDKERIHNAALLVLGKSHQETACPYCINQKLSQGGVEVKNEIQKGSVVITNEPEKKTVEVKDDVNPADNIAGKPTVGSTTDSTKDTQEVPAVIPAVAQDKAPAETQKPNIKADEEVAETDAQAPDMNARLDRVIALLESLVELEAAEAEGEETEGEEVEVEGEGINDSENDMGYEDEAKEVASEAVEEAEKEEVPAKEEKPVVVDEDEEAKAVDAKKPCECVKAVKPAIPQNTALNKRLRAIVEPLRKENEALKARIEKMEKQPLPRKEGATAVDAKPQKVEKYQPEAKQQDMKLEKKEVTFSEELSKDISKAGELRKSGKNLSKDEEAFCQRVAEKMLAEKLSK